MTNIEHELRDEIERLKSALTEIGAFNDFAASDHLEKTGSYGRFDEPYSVKKARATLARAGLGAGLAPTSVPGGAGVPTQPKIEKW